MLCHLTWWRTIEGNSMQIGSNVSTLSTLYSLNHNRASVQSSLNKLSTGRRINTGADDPAGLIAAQYLSSDITAAQSQIYSATRANAVANTAEAGMSQVSNMLGQVSALQLANATNTISADEKSANQMQIDSLLSSINRVSNNTSFAGAKLTNGTATLQSGEASVNIASMNTASLGSVTDSGVTYTLADLATGGRLSSTSGGSAQVASAVIAKAVNDVATARGKVGAFQTNDLESTINSLTETSINMGSTLSSVQDTDYATEMTNLMAASTQFKANMLVLKKQNEMTGTILSLMG